MPAHSIKSNRRRSGSIKASRHGLHAQSKQYRKSRGEILNAVERSLIEQSTEAALETELAALGAIVKGPPVLKASSEPVKAMLGGASPDDAKRLQALLVGKQGKRTKPRTSDELSDNWRQGGYPYKSRMFRKDYEEQKFVLQSELLKLQIWMKRRVSDWC